MTTARRLIITAATGAIACGLIVALLITTDAKADPPRDHIRAALAQQAYYASYGESVPIGAGAKAGDAAPAILLLAFVGTVVCAPSAVMSIRRLRRRRPRAEAATR